MQKGSNILLAKEKDWETHKLELIKRTKNNKKAIWQIERMQKKDVKHKHTRTSKHAILHKHVCLAVGQLDRVC